MTSLTLSRNIIDELAALIQKNGQPECALFTTYTFNPDWFLRRFYPLLKDPAHQEVSSSVLVMCDSRMLKRPISDGSWVQTWPGKQVFHPKIALFVFRKCTVMYAGSANLTPSGQQHQIEVCAVQQWAKRGLPASLIPLCKKIEGPLSNFLLGLPRLRSKDLLFSMNANFAKQFAQQAARHRMDSADELIIVSPFYDQEDELPSDNQDVHFLTDFAGGFRPKKTSIYLPVEQGTMERARPSVRIPPVLLKSLRNKLPKLKVYGCDPERHATGCALHAKIIAVTKGERAMILVGSANATTAGLQGSNIEASWLLQLKSTDLRHWLKAGLPSVDLTGKRLTFISPSKDFAPPCPLESALYDLQKRLLRLSFRTTKDHGTIEIYHGNNRLKCEPKGVVREFEITHDYNLRVVALRREWFVPIVVIGQMPFFSLAPMAEIDTGHPDDAFLLALTAMRPSPDDGEPPSNDRHHGAATRQKDTEDFEWHIRTHRLSSAIAWLADKLTAKSPTVRQHAFRELLRIGNSFDPHAPCTRSSDRLWRYWVRCELTRLVGILKAKGQWPGDIATHRALKSLRQRWLRIARRDEAGAAMAEMRKRIATYG